jgi:hypothetical protein
MEVGQKLTQTLWDYTVLDSFLLDYNNLTIKNVSANDFLADYVCFLTPHLLGDEERVDLKEDFFLRPTNKEPLIRGLYATVFRYGKEGVGKEALKILGDAHLGSLDYKALVPLAKSCVFSSKERLIQGRENKGYNFL